MLYQKNNSDNDVAYVAIAVIVDNTIPEGDGETIQSDGYYNPPSRDDGDRMIESVDKSGTTWTWQAQICSRNIADGPITLHYVVFDKAGNHTPDSVTGTVSNNRPRIAGAIFATDYNGDGDTADAGEQFANYSIAKSYTNYWTGGTESTPVFDPDKNVKNSNAKNPVPPKASRTLLPLKIYSEPKTKSVCMIVEINAVIPAKSAFDNFEVFTKIK